MITDTSKSVRLLILGNEQPSDHRRWEVACANSNESIEYSVINITTSRWLDKIIDFDPDIILTKPGGLSSVFKQLYDEGLMILSKELGYMCFPSLDEVLIYENKRYFSYWLNSNNIPHPETLIFYTREEAIQYLSANNLPIVGKTNIGASGSGVTILKNTKQALDYINRTFSGKGTNRRLLPDIGKGKVLNRIFQIIAHPGNLNDKILKYRIRANDKQCEFVIFQEYIPHSFEWRVVRIGDSFFAHKKLKKGDKASGSLIKEYCNPPFELLDFVKSITDKFSFYSQAIDIFEYKNRYIVNEMQCIFGQSDPYQMIVDGKPGRYLYVNNNWKFQEGDFNNNESYDLRLKTAIELYKLRRV